MEFKSIGRFSSFSHWGQLHTSQYYSRPCVSWIVFLLYFKYVYAGHELNIVLQFGPVNIEVLDKVHQNKLDKNTHLNAITFFYKIQYFRIPTVSTLM